MASEKEFQQKFRKLGELVGELEQSPVAVSQNGSRAGAREAVQLLMEVHAAALERIMELVFASGAPGEEIIGKLGADPIVRSLLLLYSLHPDDIETRVLKALETANLRLRKFDCQVELAGMDDGAVQLRLSSSGKIRASSAKSLRTLVEENLYEQAPDLVSLTILGLEEPAFGFVPLESLLRQSFAAPALAVRGGTLEDAD